MLNLDIGGLHNDARQKGVIASLPAHALVRNAKTYGDLSSEEEDAYQTSTLQKI